MSYSAHEKYPTGTSDDRLVVITIPKPFLMMKQHKMQKEKRVRHVVLLLESIKRVLLLKIVPYPPSCVGNIVLNEVSCRFHGT